MKNAIVIIPVGSSIDRTDLEGIEGIEFEDVSQLVNTLSNENEKLKDVIGVYSLTDFVDLVNNQEFDESGSWITWVNIKDTRTL